MGQESDIRRRITRLMRENGWHATAVDNEACHRGTPDIHYMYAKLSGWIELKQLATWPKRESTVVALPKFTPQQRSWLTSYWVAGGHSSLLLRVGGALRGEWFLFDGPFAADALGYRTQSELRQVVGERNILKGPLKFGWLVDVLVRLRS